ncbi:hypothetical protein FBY33_3649 [Arthrobacter sp. SLBN-112]|jgi:hypothetical protein|uniref:DUF6541 family protein n=1 Tax=Arthrobacter sp. SLBN-112 TaxID=2768452 RepID=UPI0011541090|nr:DUF6541 family protein [Arthrobacter sp. SLBN-112]TQJ41534.1 hypothetical protein FBY33_3649 [Arthrobacter sp. SLBN-112]
MTWLTFLPVVLVAMLLLYLPGAVISVCLKFSPGAVLGMAPLHSTAAVGIAGVLCGALGIHWNVVPYLAVSLLLAGFALLLTRRVPFPTHALMRGFLPFLSASVAVVLIAWRFVQLVGSPENPAQVFDNVFHLNAVRFILDTGNASSLTLASLQGVSGLDAVYPAAWHSFAALLVQLTGCDVPMAQNALNLGVSALVWPVSCLFLVASSISRRPAALILAAVMASAQVAFPYLMIVWGPLFPYALAVAMMPPAIAAVLVLAGIARGITGTQTAWAASLLLSVGGLAFAHTSSINTLLALAAPILLFLWWKRLRHPIRGRSKSEHWKFLMFTILSSGLALVSWLKLRPAPYENWGPTVKPGAAVGEILTVSPMQLAIPAVVVSVLSVTGMYQVFRRRENVWLLACYSVAAALYIVAAAAPVGALRDVIVGTWYQDTYRLAALLPIFATPLAVYGGMQLWDLWRASKRAEKLSSRLENRFRLANGTGVFVMGAAAAAAVAILATFLGPTSHYISGASTVYRFDAESDLLTPDERSLLLRVPNHVPSDAVIADNPWNGSSLAYAYTGRRVLTAHLFSGKDTTRSIIDQRLKFEPEAPEVCSALRLKGVQFVLDFGDKYLIDLDGAKDFQGVTNIGTSPGFDLVDSEGRDAKLYRINACD